MISCSSSATGAYTCTYTYTYTYTSPCSSYSSVDLLVGRHNGPSYHTEGAALWFNDGSELSQPVGLLSLGEEIGECIDQCVGGLGGKVCEARAKRGEERRVIRLLL